jgi:5-methylcytosine-specific restriction endonuclease McrBC regulatory subunit McrC
MTGREQIERQIRELLAAETDAIRLSNQLFTPDGLFNRLARTEEERRTLSRSELFQQAQRRLTELQRSEAAEFVRTVEQAEATVSAGGYLHKLERAESR